MGETRCDVCNHFVDGNRCSGRNRFSPGANMLTTVNTFEQLDKALSERGIVPIKKGQFDDEDRCCTKVLYEYHLATDGRQNVPLITVEYCVSGKGDIFMILTAEMFDVSLDEDGSIIGRADEGVSLLDVVNKECHLPRCMSKTFNASYQNDVVEAKLAEIIEAKLRR